MVLSEGRCDMSIWRKVNKRFYKNYWLDRWIKKNRLEKKSRKSEVCEVSQEREKNNWKTSKEFWNCVDKRGEDYCWNWLCYINKDGYGMYKGKMAHRISYMIVFGNIPKNKPIIRHKCDNRSCVNPNHLEWGTHEDNMRDTRVRGRRRGDGRYFEYK